MDVYDDDEEEEVVSSESDDDEVEFVSSKRRFQYKTFDDHKHQDDEEDDGKEDAIYGVFRSRSATRSRPAANASESSSSTPMFVKSSTDGASENVDRVTVAASEFVPAVDKETETVDVDGESRLGEAAMREKQEEANQKFFALLGRARDGKRKRVERPEELTQQGRLGPHTEPSGRAGIKDEGVGIGLDFHPQDSRSSGFGLGFQPSRSSRDGGGPGYKASNEAEDSSVSFKRLGAQPSRFGVQPQPTPVQIDPNLGKWEKHTKGIGMKLLTKMGYAGSGGLGAKSKKNKLADGVVKGGISRPVEVVVRPNNLGLGFGNFKEATKLKANKQIEAEIRGEELHNHDENADPGERPRKSSALPSTDELLKHQSWNRSVNQVSRRRQRRTVIPYTEILEKQSEAVIIDMRGPSAGTTSTVHLPLAEELLHNVSMLLNTHENKLRSESYFLQTSQEKLHSLRSDLDVMERRIRVEQERMLTMEKVLKVVDEIENACLGTDSIDQRMIKVESIVEKLRGSLMKEDRVAMQFDEVLVVSFFEPFIKSQVDKWEPLREGPGKALSVVDSLMSMGSSMGDSGLIAERRRCVLLRNLLPRVKSVFESTKWNPILDAACGIDLYESLVKAVERYSVDADITLVDANVFPSGDPEVGDLKDVVANELLRDSIFPKLMRVLNQWKPQINERGNGIQDGLETWLLPWMPQLDRPATLSHLLPDLKRQVQGSLSCLSRAAAGNKNFLGSALSTLGSWKIWLKKESVYDLASKYITPAFVKYFRHLTIVLNPERQDWYEVDMLVTIYEKGMMARLEFLSLLEGELLPMWMQTLHSHLFQSHKNPDVWLSATLYTAWRRRIFGLSKSQAAAELRNDEIICRIFYTALKMIESAAQTNVDALAPLAPCRTTFKEVYVRRVKDFRDQNEVELERLQAKNAIAFRKNLIDRQFGGMATFREVVEDFASEHDIIFRPRTGGIEITEDGKQVFLFGSVPIYLDVDVIFALENGQWRPISIEDLLKRARQPLSQR